MSTSSATAPTPTTVRTGPRHCGLLSCRGSFREPPGGASAAPATLEGQDRFAPYVAHELRAPIALQRTLVEVTLADPDAETAALRQMGERVIASCEQQQQLIEALLDLTRSRGGLSRDEPVDLAAIAGEALRAHDRSGLESVVALEPAWTSGDPTLVERLAANLISNAIRHNRLGGRIEVATRTQAGHAVLVVANSGPLIPAGELRRLFQPFQRLDSRAEPPSEGIGLGLSIVEAIAGAHNGNLTAAALSGGGLKIDVYFPAVPSGGGSASASADL
jgi:signal transduction histidine kinase